MSAHHLRPLAVVLSTALLAACQSSTSSQAPGAPSGPGSTAGTRETTAGPAATTTGSLPPEFAHVFDIPANPIAVTPTLDPAKAVERDIPIEGGELTATGADGTTFVLRIPGDALASAAHIRITPVSAIDGMPFGTDPHAVQLEPEGLQFRNFVTLTITPKTPIPPDRQVFFGYTGNGGNLTLALPVADSADISLRLLHFSGAGVTNGAAAEVAQVQSRLGADAEARMASSIAAEFTRLRSAELLGQSTDPLDTAAALDLIRQIYEQVVAPLIATAASSCEAGQSAVDMIVRLERERQLLGATGGDAGSTALPDLVETVADRCVRDEYQHCHDDHVIQHVLPTWQEKVRQIDRLGVPNPTLREALAALVEKCLVFDLEFQSMVAGGGSGDSGWDSYVKATLQLRFNAQTMRFGAAQATLENWKFIFRPGGGCTGDSRPGNGLFRVMDFKYVTDVSSPAGGTGFVSDFELDYVAGPSTESVTIVCPNGQSTLGGPSGLGLWSGPFIFLHKDEAGVTSPGVPLTSFVFAAKSWEILGGHHYANKAWNLSAEGTVEAGTFDLYHSPE